MVAQRKGGLGRGLGSLIPSEAAASTSAAASSLQEIPVSMISPNRYQPRAEFSEEELVSLADSIKALGVLQPILVRKVDDANYELIAGERRWRAAKRAGLDRVPAVVREVGDKGALEQALVENLHRADLNAIEEAAAYQQLVDEFDLTQDEVAARVGKSRSAVANTLRLFQLPAAVQAMIIDGSLSAGHGRAILSAPIGEQKALAEQVVIEGLSVRALESRLKPADEAEAETEAEEPRAADAGESPSAGDVGETRPAALLELEQLLADHLETRVGVTLSQKRGRIAIDFADIDDLERIYRQMMPTE